MMARLEQADRWIPGTSPGMTIVEPSRAVDSGVIPALVAGTQPSICADDRRSLHTGQRGIQISPMRVLPLDQVHLPFSRPLLHRFFALDRVPRLGELLKPDEAVHLVIAGEVRRLASAMLFDTADDAVGDADVERPSGLAGEDVDPIAPHDAPQDWRTEYAAGWIAGTSPAMTRVAHEAVQ